MKKQSNIITLSVVVIGRNEGRRLKECLDSIKRMTFPQVQQELIYVDSMSADDSVEEAKSSGAEVINIRSDLLTAALARNMGWRAAKGQYVLFLDADTVVDPLFVSYAISEFENPKVGVVSGKLSERYPDESLFNRVFDLDWNIEGKEYCGGNALIRKEALEKVRGYNPKLIAGEEPEMCQRLIAEGYQIRHINVPMALHDLGMKTFKQYWKRCFRGGYAYALISNLPKHTLWKNESRHNFVKGSLMIIGFAIVLALLILKGTFLPFSIYTFLLSTFILRTTLKVLKKNRWTTALLYGIHSHLQHIPILCGQLTYWKDYFLSRRRGLIEYK